MPIHDHKLGRLVSMINYRNGYVIYAKNIIIIKYGLFIVPNVIMIFV